MKIKSILLFIVISFLYPKVILAHPGRTAADGCHYCRTNCASWGVAQDERHCHGGSTAPVVTASPTRVSTPAPTRVYTPTPTKVITPTPTKRITPTSTTTKTVTIAPAVNPLGVTITPKPVGMTTRTSNSGFWAWLLKLFGTK